VIAFAVKTWPCFEQPEGKGGDSNFCDTTCNKWFRKARIAKCMNRKKNHPVFAKGLYLWAIDGIVGLAFLASVLNNEKTLRWDFRFFETSEEQL
jgi:hypothetical protein